MGEKVTTSETNDVIVKFYLDIGVNDDNFTYAYGEGKIYLMLHQKNHSYSRMWNFNTNKRVWVSL